MRYTVDITTPEGRTIFMHLSTFNFSLGVKSTGDDLERLLTLIRKGKDWKVKITEVS